MSAREFVRRLVGAMTASPPIDPLAIARARADIASLVQSLKRAIDERDEARERAERHRLAWTSARRRARRYDDLVDELDERCSQFRTDRDEARADAVTNGQAAERLSGELAEARRTIQLLRAALDDRPLDPEGFGRLRAALDEERIEPGWADREAAWMLPAPKGYQCAAGCGHAIHVHRAHGCDVGECSCEAPHGRILPSPEAQGRTEGQAG